MNYGEQLKDPRWQKRRLEIMQRDNFTCRRCGNGLNDGVSLNVHHFTYRKCKPWEYFDYELVTLCENCHHEIHDIEPKETHQLKTQKAVANNLKLIFYRNLLKDKKELTPNGKMVYSFLVSKSLLKNKLVFNTKGLRLYETMITNALRDKGNWIKMCNISKSRMSRELHISLNTTIRTFHDLEKNGYIKSCDGQWKVYVDWELLSGGYFELHRLGEVNGMLAIFYAYLADKGSRHDYNIDTWKVQMARDLDTTFIAITNLLNRLYRLNLAKRLPNGRLQVTPPEKQKSESRQEPTPAANILRQNKVQNVTAGKTSLHLYGRLIQPLPNHNW